MKIKGSKGLRKMSLLLIESRDRRFRGKRVSKLSDQGIEGFPYKI